jgi:putative ATP-dependent endonuclease of OLD family
MPIPVSVINDLDIRPDKYKEVDPIAKTWADFDVEAERTQKCLHYEGQKVKAFVSTAWTLEYTIALSSDLRWLLLKSILYAEKEQNSNKYGVTEKKAEIIDQEVAEIEVTAKSESWSDEKIAFYIYHDQLLKKEISKAITAQWMADLLLAKQSDFKPILENDQHLKYLVNAIKYAAGVVDYVPNK